MKRILSLFSVLFLVTLVTFVMTDLAPSDSAEMYYLSKGITPSEEVLNETRHEMGLDKNIVVRYVDWLNDFGVRYFETQMPSDLEYDPQLGIVAEWKDQATLQKDHQDNAMMDALLEQANAGRKLQYNKWLLPVARLLKAWSFCMNLVGKEGIIPEGMTATQALKNEYFTSLHKEGIAQLLHKADAFRQQKGYAAPYWQLLAMSREILLKSAP